jgi:hypothetical protein
MRHAHDHSLLGLLRSTSAWSDPSLSVRDRDRADQSPPTKSPTHKSLRYLEGHFWVDEGRATPIFEYLHKISLWGSASD